MFDLSILNLSTNGQKRAAVASQLRAVIDRGDFMYTDLLMTQEPLRTMGLESLDGVELQGNIPVYQQHIANDWDGETIRLVHVDPDKQLIAPVMKEVRVPGTSIIKKQKRYQNLGNIADVADKPGVRTARLLLAIHGWPVKQQMGGRVGTVVEWRWLVREANLPNPVEGVPEMFEALSARMEAWEKAKLTAPVVTKPMQAKTPDKGVGVR